ncbi:cell wall metabolism sensor histidine kinase WalK [Elizabethkingia sp. JS20170427COW]|uniref:sensor histidine kinase n=1 Tax=Elizabethkingia sp. JS20170427COW TaxID=2583851 RepID=UPI0011101958|nr:HAMP domain-containing sensor histidine kinase [Elizabethkingia sp. JS20170427COW]QCX54027.1 HAMP domain-containing histidine kinase [Elizabethkingia sp. JS20170427COW]
MKNLLQKSLVQLAIFAFVVFSLSIPSYFFLVDWIWLKELDENNHLIAERISNEFNEQEISNEKLVEYIQFWNEIQAVGKIIPTKEPIKQDSLYTIMRENPYVTREDIVDRYRGLKTNITINHQNYILVVETNVEETEETVAYIAAVTLMFFLILVIGFWILNKRQSKRIWVPFRDTLQKLKNFQLNDQKLISFQETDIIEFAELNQTLEKLLQHTITIYKSQKEFTENASHELQTPLAVLKSKLAILLQNKDLTEEQYHIVEEMNKALIRSSKINKNLLLLAKIENKQFNHSEKIALDVLVSQSIENFQEFFQDKNLKIILDLQSPIQATGNIGLTEILVNNIIVNAIRYTAPEGKVRVQLSDYVLEVRNTGTQALPSEALFKRFSKASSHNSGSGLGLSIVYEICRFQGWEISYHFAQNEHIFIIRFKK